MDTELCNRNTQCHYKVSGEDRKIWVKYSHVILEHQEILHNLLKIQITNTNKICRNTHKIRQFWHWY